MHISEAWIEPPFLPAIPVEEPGPPVIPVEAAFPKRVRDWWMRVGNYQCQVEIYTEQKGFFNCGLPAEHVHHIIPESQLLEDGEEPNNSVGLPACKFHHVGRGNEDENMPFSGDFSFHPDIGEAYELYRHGDASAFKRAAIHHQEAAQQGERFWGGDEGTDEHYLQKMQDLAWVYESEHPDDPKPDVKPHLRFQKKGWFL